MTRPQALEAVAEAARRVIERATRDDDYESWNINGQRLDALGAALGELATLDALPTTPAAAAPPTDEELEAIATVAWDVSCLDSGRDRSPHADERRALYTRGTQDGRVAMLAEVVARLRSHAAGHAAINRELESTLCDELAGTIELEFR